MPRRPLKHGVKDNVHIQEHAHHPYFFIFSSSRSCSISSSLSGWSVFHTPIKSVGDCRGSAACSCSSDCKMREANARRTCVDHVRTSCHHTPESLSTCLILMVSSPHNPLLSLLIIPAGRFLVQCCFAPSSVRVVCELARLWCGDIIIADHRRICSYCSVNVIVGYRSHLNDDRTVVLSRSASPPWGTHNFLSSPLV